MSNIKHSINKTHCREHLLLHSNDLVKMPVIWVYYFKKQRNFYLHLEFYYWTLVQGELLAGWLLWGCTKQYKCHGTLLHHGTKLNCTANSRWGSLLGLSDSSHDDSCMLEANDKQLRGSRFLPKTTSLIHLCKIGSWPKGLPPSLNRKASTGDEVHPGVCCLLLVFETQGLCSPSQPGTQWFSCLCLPDARIKDVCGCTWSICFPYGNLCPGQEWT